MHKKGGFGPPFYFMNKNWLQEMADRVRHDAAL
jgi:hypothetical protein